MLKEQTLSNSESSVTAMQLNWATLKFFRSSEIHLEKLFLDNYFSKNLSHVRYCHFYTIIFYILAGCIDYFIFPDDLVALFSVRFLVVVPVFIVGYIFTYSRHYRKVWQRISFLYILITGWSFILFTMIAQPPGGYGYYVGVLFCMMFGYTFIRERFIYASIAGLILLSSYLFISSIVIKMPAQDLFYSNFYLCLVNFLGMLIARHLETSARKDFYLKHKLSKEQEKFLEFNHQLEDIVAERTKELQKEIIERRQIEKALRESREHLQSLFLAVPTGIGVVTNRVLKQVNVQICDMTGYAEKELIGQSARILYPSDKEFEFVGHEKYKRIDKQGTGTVETRWKHRDGHIIDVLLSSRPMDLSDLSKGVTFTALDITERKRALELLRESEEKMLQLQKMESIGTLAGGIAHDFNNILFPILGNTEMLREDLPEDSPFRKNVNSIFHGTMRAKELVKQILTFARQDNIEVKLMKIQPVVKETLKLIRSTIPTSIEINQNIANDCGPIEADPTQVHQIVMNLATNAYHAMEDTGGKLSVNLDEIELAEGDVTIFDLAPGPYACLTVTDTGMGIGSDIKEKIFDPFFTTKKLDKGTGMGLSVIHGIVQGAGGSITVSSEPGQGAEFRVYLPVVKDPFEYQESQVKEPIQPGTEQILLVDDEYAIATIEKQMLERLGYSVVSRTSSIDALEAFRANPGKFDLVITDMAMPNMSGDVLASEMVKIRPDMPILLCTGFSERIPEGKAAAMGIKNFLMKPITIQDLSKTVREVLDNK